MADLQWTDNAESVLTAAIASSDSPATVNVTGGQGAKFPSISGSQWFPIIIVKADTFEFEELRVTARATDSMTATREQGGTTALDFEIGDMVYLPFAQSVFSSILLTQDALESGRPHFCGAAGGSANALTLAATPTLTQIVDGTTLSFRAAATNDAAVTCNPDSLGAKAVIDPEGNALTGGEIVTGGHYLLQYNGTSLILMNPSPVARTLSAFRGLPTGDQSGVATGTWTLVAYAGTEELDAADDFVSSVFTARRTGLHLFTWLVGTATALDADTVFATRLNINSGTAEAGGRSVGGLGGVSTVHALSGSALVYLTAGDTVQPEVFHTQGSNIVLDGDGSTTGHPMHFAGQEMATNVRI